MVQKKKKLGMVYFQICFTVVLTSILYVMVYAS